MRPIYSNDQVGKRRQGAVSGNALPETILLSFSKKAASVYPNESMACLDMQRPSDHLRAF